ncbi:hypothetical protein NADFUDRAFT_49675 [Nadsonia fulvescens var. elongata DSM 6958]|uniref:BAH-domain-containing protein n=1 Tax=Nadsonia fulvescens var. elongata DSM 6958 TaxID=857566 RepID=A0A1E3PPK4_9ASCO|nr:hypothetical protein NADFUDRAFT_49675 [Nadsonia fulvescens var. elongata DSM 6958]
MTSASSPVEFSIPLQPVDVVTEITMTAPQKPVQQTVDPHNEIVNSNNRDTTISNKNDPNKWSKRARRRTSRINYAEDALDEKANSKEELVADKTKGLSGSTNASNKTLKPSKALATQRKAQRNATSSTSTTPLCSSSPSLSSSDQTSSALPSRNNFNDQDDSYIVNERIPSNWQPRSIASDRLTGILDLEDSVIKPDGKLYLHDGSNYSPGDYVYMISEPPGEPYYICRIMEFVDHTKLASAKSAAFTTTLKETDNLKAVNNKSDQAVTRRNSIITRSVSNYSVRVNWLYRPKDISRKTSDPRLLYVTMHSDVCPLISIRGHCSVKHKDFIEDFDMYRAKPNNFWFDKFYDRYILRFFDVVPTAKMINLPNYVAKVLCERFTYVLVEVGKAKELCESPKNCVKCSQWCSPEDSVQCAHCQNHYHMLCVDPPLTRKPSRGFGWSCASCSRALEMKMRQEKGYSLEDEEDPTVDNLATLPPAIPTENNTELATSRENSTSLSRYEELDRAFAEKTSQPLDAAQVHQLKMWPFRYLGIHSKIEDVLDADDRIYPRAVSRLGTKHQANIADWPGRPVIYYEPEKKSKRGGHGKAKRNNTTPTPNITADDIIATNLSSNTSISNNIEELSSINTRENSPVPDSLLMTKKKDRPAWFQERPSGYIERGNDVTSALLWKEPADESRVDEFLKKTEPFATKLQLAPNSPNFVDACLKALLDFEYDQVKALKVVSTFTRKSLKEPTFTKEEKARFEEAVRKYGSELHPVYKEVKTKKSADIVRYYYLWKKTPSGHKIWDNFEGRKKKKPATTTINNTTTTSKTTPAEAQISTTVTIERKDPEDLEELADSADDSAFDSTKAKFHKRSFICKHCSTTSSRVWKRAPGHSVTLSDEDHENEDSKTSRKHDVINNPVMALCFRCARLWRRYAVIWEEPEEVMKKLTQKGGNGWKRKLEEELIEDARQILAEKEKSKDKTRVTKRQKVDKTINTTGLSGIRNSEQQSWATKQTEKSVKVILPIPASSFLDMPITSIKNLKEKETEKPAKENAKAKVKAKILMEKEKEKEEDKTKIIPTKEKDKEKKVRIKKEDKTKLTKPTKIVAAKVEPKQNTEITTRSSDTTDLCSSTESTEKLTSYPLLAKKSTKMKGVMPSSKKILPLIANNSGNTDLRIKEFKPFIRATSIEAPPSILTSFSSPSKVCRPCRVCDQSEPNDKQLVCDNCGVNVHTYCYDSSSEHTFPNNWLCDPCANDQKPTASTLYSCILCSSRETNHDASKEETNIRLSKPTGNNQNQIINSDGSKNTVVEALKRTSGNNWIHVKCAIWNPDLKFEDVKTLQPVEGISQICFRRPHNSEICQICKSLSGVHACCFICHKAVHVSCASKAGYKFGFSVEPISQNSATNEKTVTVDGTESIISAVIACPHHTEIYKLIETNKVMDNTSKMTAIQLYCQTYKQSSNKLTGVMRASKNFDFLTRSESLLLQDDVIKRNYSVFDNCNNIDYSMPETAKSTGKRCEICETSLTPIWWKNPTDSSKEICHRCYWKINDQGRYRNEYQSTKRIKLLYEDATEAHTYDETRSKTKKIMAQDLRFSISDSKLGSTNPSATETSLNMLNRTPPESTFNMTALPIPVKSTSVSPKISPPTSLQLPILSTNHHHPQAYHPSPLAPPHQSSYTEMRYPVSAHPMNMNQYAQQSGMPYNYSSHSPVMYHNNNNNPPTYPYVHPFSNSSPRPPPLPQHHLTNSMPSLGHNVGMNSPYISPYPQGTFYGHISTPNMHQSPPLPVSVIRNIPMTIDQLTHSGEERGAMNGTDSSKHEKRSTESSSVMVTKKENNESKRDIMALNKILS